MNSKKMQTAQSYINQEAVKNDKFFTASLIKLIYNATSCRGIKREGLKGSQLFSL